MNLLAAVNTLPVIGAVILLGGIVFFIASLVRFIKLRLDDKVNYRKLLIEHLLTVGASAAGLLLTFASLLYSLDPLPEGGYLWNALGGGALFIISLEWILTAVFIYIYKGYLKKELPDEYRPLVKATIYILALPVFVFLSMFLDGIVPLLSFPLPKGIPFDDPLVTFYALFILGGALLVYYMGDLRMQKEGFRAGYIENVFLVAFPSGVIGARIWYVAGQWATEFAGKPWWKPFALWEGGLAIMGGALFGALAGIIFVKLRRKDINLLWGADFIVPSILIAQAVGRWGNFFNQEVYGAAADVSGWMFLPEFIRSQMVISGHFRVPLFLIESFVNLSGYFIIIFAVGKLLKKYLKPGDQALMYVVWYGLTRVIMEPMRDPEFIMNNLWSWIWGFIFAGLGLLAIIANHVWPFILSKKHASPENK